MLEFNAATKGRLRDVATFNRGWGGDTSNFAVTVARLGRTVGYVCRVGDDEFGKCFLDLWKREGVDTSHVIVEKGGFTGIYFISIRNEGEHDFTYYRTNSSASHLSPDDLDPTYIEGAKVFHSSGISQAISQSCRETVFKAVEIAKRSGVLFSYDPNLRLKLWPIHTARAIVMRTMELADVVMPSMEDMRAIAGAISPEAAARQILKRGPRIVAIKLGAEGCVVGTDKKMVRVPGFRVTPIDTTGAGDAFDGAFTVGLLEGWELEETAEFANAVGALTTLGKGAVEPLPRRNQVYEFIESHRRKTRR
jgi:2-dehydro-3-deoxygluconokinase